MTFKLNEEQVRAILEDTKPDIVGALKKQIADNASYSIDYNAREIISAAVTEWIKENIVPELLEALVLSKASIVSAAISSAGEIAEALAVSMATSLKEKLEKSYQRSQIFKAMFE